MKRGTDQEALLLGTIMPTITCDIFPPADILNRILSEFMTSRPLVAYNLTPTIFKVNSEWKMYFFLNIQPQFHILLSGLWNCSISRSTESCDSMDLIESCQFHWSCHRSRRFRSLEYTLFLLCRVQQSLAKVTVGFFLWLLSIKNMFSVQLLYISNG